MIQAKVDIYKTSPRSLREWWERCQATRSHLPTVVDTSRGFRYWISKGRVYTRQKVRDGSIINVDFLPTYSTLSSCEW
jgi:hypothetical protein